MPNPVPAKYTVQLGPTFTPEVAGELAAWAELLGESTSVITRQCTEAGLAVLREVYASDAVTRGLARASTAASLPGRALLRKHVEAARERGNRQVKRRRNYDERTRKGETGMAETLQERRAAKTHELPEIDEPAAATGA